MFRHGFKSWCEKFSEQQRRELSLQAIEPLDPIQLARHLEVQVIKPEQIPGIDASCLNALTRDDPESWSAITLRVATRDLIILNPTHRGARPISDLMHEISHILLNHKASPVDITDGGLLMLNAYDKQQEDEAQWLAGCLLLPRIALMSIRKRAMTHSLAAKTYNVSLDMLEWRFRVTGVDHQLKRRRRPS